MLCLLALVFLDAVSPTRALSPLPYVHHYKATDGSWLGARVPDDVLKNSLRSRRLAEMVSLRGDVALTTATGTVLQQNGASVGSCNPYGASKCNIAVGEDVYGPFEAGCV